MVGVGFQTPDGQKPVAVPWKTVLIIVAVVVVLILLNSTIYSVEANEVGIVQRFGRFTGDEKPPGLHFKLPWGIDKVTKVPVSLVRKQEFGFRTEKAGIQTRYATTSTSFDSVSLMLSGDLNCAVVEWSVQYTIKDPGAFLFNVRAPEKTLRDLSESIMREMVGERSVTEVITLERQTINTEVRRNLQETLDSYDSGINVTQVILKNVTPPDKVKPSFNEVNQAQQEMDRTINQAWQDYNQAIPKAKGDALRVISEAEGYATERVNRSLGDVARFNRIYVEYKKAKKITRWRMYLETMSEVLPEVSKKIIIDSDVGSVLPMLDLNRGWNGEDYKPGGSTGGRERRSP